MNRYTFSRANTDVRRLEAGKFKRFYPYETIGKVERSGNAFRKYHEFRTRSDNERRRVFQKFLFETFFTHAVSGMVQSYAGAYKTPTPKIPSVYSVSLEIGDKNRAEVLMGRIRSGSVHYAERAANPLGREEALGMIENFHLALRRLALFNEIKRNEKFVHGDYYPKHVLCDANGRVSLVDFGLAIVQPLLKNDELTQEPVFRSFLIRENEALLELSVASLAIMAGEPLGHGQARSLVEGRKKLFHEAYYDPHGVSPIFSDWPALIRQSAAEFGVSVSDVRRDRCGGTVFKFGESPVPGLF